MFCLILQDDSTSCFFPFDPLVNPEPRPSGMTGELVTTVLLAKVFHHFFVCLHF